MEDPCDLCREGGVCGAKFPCKRKDAYNRWKQKAEEIRKHIKEVMARAQEGETHD